MRDYARILERRKGQAQQIQIQIEELEKRKIILTELREEVETAQGIIQTVAQETQQKLEYHISELVTLALNAVFDDPYKLVLRFDSKRGKTEADLLFEREGDQVDPLTATGGGAVDVAAFALRVALWSLRRPRSRRTLILDEPFKHLKGEEANRKVIQMVKDVSEKLGVQILMVSDERVPMHEIEKGADRVFRVSMKKGVSQVEVG